MTKIKGLHNLRKPAKTITSRGKKLEHVSRSMYTTLANFKKAMHQKTKHAQNKYGGLAVAMKNEVVDSNKNYYVLDIYSQK